MPRPAFLIFAAALVIMACSLTSVAPSSPPTSAPIPSAANTALPLSTSSPSDTAAAPTVASPAAPSGTSVSYGNLSLVIPDGLSSGTTNTTGPDVEFPYTNPSNGDMPQHVKVILNGYPVSGALLPPEVMVFSAAQYAGYADLTQQIISTLQTLQYQDGQLLPAGLPSGTFNAHVQSVSLASGRGLRYLTQFDQSPLPANNQELIYYFNGLTADGASYVQVILPVTALFLAPDNNPNSQLPSGGVPFNMDQPAQYFQQIADKLNATAPDGFTPSLATLDALVQSITVTP